MATKITPGIHGAAKALQRLLVDPSPRPGASRAAVPLTSCSSAHQPCAQLVAASSSCPPRCHVRIHLEGTGLSCCVSAARLPTVPRMRMNAHERPLPLQVAPAVPSFPPSTHPCSPCAPPRPGGKANNSASRARRTRRNRCRHTPAPSEHLPP